MLVKKDLGNLAARHAVEILNYDNSLCNCLFSGAEIWLPMVASYSFLDKKIEVSTFSDLSQGGVAEKTPNYLSSYLINEYKSSCTTFALFDDVMLDPADDSLKLDQVSTTYVGQEVYHWCDLANISSNSLRKLIWATSVSWHFVCIVFKSTDKINNEMLTCSLANNLAGVDLLEIILGAYDGEGFVHYKFE